MTRPTVAQALAVALDHAEETGELGPELIRRMAALLADVETPIAYGWIDIPGPAGTRIRYGMLPHRAAWARVSHRGGDWIPHLPQHRREVWPRFETAKAAMEWCDQELGTAGVILLDRPCVPR